MNNVLFLKTSDGHFALGDSSYSALDVTPILTRQDIHMIVNHELRVIKAKAWKSAIRRSRRKH